jgi:hypothetical protein
MVSPPNYTLSLQQHIQQWIIGLAAVSGGWLSTDGVIAALRELGIAREYAHGFVTSGVADGLWSFGEGGKLVPTVAEQALPAQPALRPWQPVFQGPPSRADQVSIALFHQFGLDLPTLRLPGGGEIEAAMIGADWDAIEDAGEERQEEFAAREIAEMLAGFYAMIALTGKVC